VVLVLESVVLDVACVVDEEELVDGVTELAGVVVPVAD
jgi:hypothetical protein